MSDLDIYSLWDQVMQKTKTKMPPQMWDSLVVNSLMPYSMTSTVLTLFVMEPSKLKYIQSPLVHTPILESTKNLLPSIQTIEYLTDLPTATDAMPDIDMPSFDYGDTTETTIAPPWDIADHQGLPDGASLPNYDSPVVIQRTTPRGQDIQKPVPTDLFETKDTISVTPTIHEQRQVPNTSKSHLNRAFTFDNYIESNSNRFAFSAAKAVAEKPGIRYNPLYIHGQSGLGKTHLMHAIGNEILKNNPSAKIMSITSEDFMNSFIESLRTKTPDQFRRNFRDIDVLIIDDVQFLEEKNKKTTQEEFFNTFN